MNTPNNQTISIQPWEKSLLDEIEKSIITSNPGFNPCQQWRINNN